MTDVAATLTARGEAYGEFGLMSDTAQELKSLMRNSPSWRQMSSAQREALDVIATKLARLLVGDPNHADSWHDIAGYARLCEVRCPPKTPVDGCRSATA